MSIKPTDDYLIKLFQEESMKQIPSEYQEEQIRIAKDYGMYEEASAMEYELYNTNYFK